MVDIRLPEVQPSATASPRGGAATDNGSRPVKTPTPTASESARIDLLLEDGRAADLIGAYDTVRQEGGKIVAVGSYPKRSIGRRPICYLEVSARSPTRIAEMLARIGYRVLAVYPSGRATPEPPKTLA